MSSDEKQLFGGSIFNAGDFDVIAKAVAASANLKGLLDKSEAKGLYYNGKEISVDGYKFIECRFDNCKLVVSSLNFEFTRCVIDPSTQIVYSERIAKIVRLYLSRLHWATSTHFEDYFLPTRNEDGSISVEDRKN